MEMKLRQHMDELFSEVPVNRQSVEIKEEILQNITDKYHDLLNEGKSEDAAYHIAIASIGDLTELLESLKSTEAPIDDDAVRRYNEWKKNSALRTSIAVALYILSVVPPIITDALGGNENLAAAGLCFIAAIATGILVYNHNSKPINPFQAQSMSMAEDFKKWQGKKENLTRARKDITSAMWAIILVLYFVISFATMKWYITWVLFPMGIAVKYIIHAIFTLQEAEDERK